MWRRLGTLYVYFARKKEEVLYYEAKASDTIFFLNELIL